MILPLTTLSLFCSRRRRRCSVPQSSWRAAVFPADSTSCRQVNTILGDRDTGPPIWYPGAQSVEGRSSDGGGHHRGRVGSCRLRPEGDSQGRSAAGRLRRAGPRHQLHPSVDYPDFGTAMAEALPRARPSAASSSAAPGIGISMAANRNPKVRAALAHDVTSARLSRLHNDANVVAFGQRLIGTETAREALKVFLGTEFEGGRHANRVAKLSRVARHESSRREDDRDAAADVHAQPRRGRSGDRCGASRASCIASASRSSSSPRRTSSRAPCSRPRARC